MSIEILPSTYACRFDSDDDLKAAVDDFTKKKNVISALNAGAYVAAVFIITLHVRRLIKKFFE